MKNKNKKIYIEMFKSSKNQKNILGISGVGIYGIIAKREISEIILIRP